MVVSVLTMLGMATIAADDGSVAWKVRAGVRTEVSASTFRLDRD
jgi:hypothetical protein